MSLGKPLIILIALLFSLPAAARDFDYWVLSLSWSPSWCQDHDSEEQCRPGRHPGFVVHGLWPQYAAGGYPSFCLKDPPAVPEDEIRRMLPLMPGRKLIEWEWRKHGSCAENDPRAYFAATRAAADRLRVPDDLANPARPLRLTAAEVERLFADANPGLDGRSIAVVCTKGRLTEIRACLSRALTFIPCGRDVTDRCKGTASLPPPP